MHRCEHLAIAVITVCSLVTVGLAADPPPAGTTAKIGEAGRLPIREVTVFKDGHAFVLAEGPVQLNEAGRAVLEDLPAPVLGTFWPYSGEPAVVLRSVVAGKRNVLVEEPALNIRDLLEANTGAVVQVYEVDGREYTATILGIPEPRESEEREAGRAPVPSLQAEPRVGGPERASIVLLQTLEQTKAVPLDRIRDISFREAPRRTRGVNRTRNVLTLNLASVAAAPKTDARVGMVYLQKGLRWIPGYQVSIDGKGSAVVKLQATLINELADLEDVKINLVVGVPTFAFKDSLDPMALQETAARLSRHFQPQSQTAYAFYNGIMSQAPMYEPPGRPAAPDEPSLGPELPAGAKSEDLFIFALENISLAKGDRMVVPVAEYKVSYKDVHVLDLPFGPPVELARSREIGERDPQAMRLLVIPKVMHKLRIANTTRHPFTTAPALIVRDGRALAQGMMAYTPVNATCDLELTIAVDVRAKKNDIEIERVPNAMNWNNVNLARINLAGTVSLTNTRDRPIEIEVVRHVLGHVDTADAGGEAEQTNAPEDAWQFTTPPDWYRWYSWPSWWHRVNGLGRIRWEIRLEPGETRELNYTWHYFWG